MKIWSLFIISILCLVLSYGVASIMMSSFIDAKIEGNINIDGETESYLYIGSEVENSINVWLINWTLSRMNDNMVIDFVDENLSVGECFETVYLIKNEGTNPFLLDFSIYDDWFYNVSSPYYGFTYGVKKLDMGSYFLTVHHNIESIVNNSNFWYDISNSQVILNSSSSDVDYSEYLCFKVWYCANDLMIKPNESIHTCVFINLTRLNNYVPYEQVNHEPAEQKDFIAYWSFNEGSGTSANDYTGNNHNGTISNGVWIEGVSGHGISFNGNGKIEIEDINLGDDWSFLFWVNLDSYRSTCSNILGWGGPDGFPNYAASIWTSTNDVRTACGGYYGAVPCSSSSNAYYDWIGKWNHVSIICDSGVITYYINGIENTNKATYGLCGLWVNRIAGFGDYVHWFDGCLDEMVLFNKPITYDNMLYYYLST